MKRVPLPHSIKQQRALRARRDEAAHAETTASGVQS